MAIDPAFLQIGWGDSFQSAMQGYELGQKISNNSAMLNSAKAAEERKQIEFQQQQKMQEDMYNFSLMPNKTHEDYTNMITRYPKLAEDYKKSWEIMDQGQRQQSLSTAAQVMSAIKMGSPDVAKQILEDQAIAYENSGHKESAFNMRRMGGLIDKNPNSIYSSLGLFGSAVSPDEFASMIDKMGNNVRADQMQPYEIDEIQSRTANNYSQVSDRQEGRRIQEREVELKDNQFYAGLAQNQQQFYDKLDHEDKITARKLAANKAETSIQRMERLEKVETLSEATRNAATASKYAATLANDLKALNEGAGGGHDILFRKIPGTDEYELNRRIETLKSNIFLTQIEKMRGFGALTEAEGKRLVESIESLDPSQSPVLLQKNLTTIAQQLSKVAQSANKKTQIYATNGRGYSQAVIDAAKELGITPAEAQKFVNQKGL